MGDGGWNIYLEYKKYGVLLFTIVQSGLDIKQFGPLAQGGSKFEKLLAHGPVDLRSYWSTNSRHRQHAHSLWRNRSNGKSCFYSVHGYINTHFSLTFPKTWMNKIFVIYPLFFIVYFTPKHSENNIIIQPTMHKHENWKQFWPFDRKHSNMQIQVIGGSYW